MNNFKTLTSKKKKNIFISLFLVLVLLIAGAYAFLSATDSKINVFTAGYVDIILHEDNWCDENGNIINDENGNGIPDFADGIMPGAIIDKAPYVENTGLNDAWTFISVAVPTVPASDLVGDAETGDTGIEGRRLSVKVVAYAIQEGFIDDGSEETLNTVWNKYSDYATMFGAEASDVAPEDRVEVFDIITNGAYGYDSTEWLPIDEVYQSEDGNNYYIFGYNGKLAAGAETSKIFEQVEFSGDIGKDY